MNTTVPSAKNNESAGILTNMFNWVFQMTEGNADLYVFSKNGVHLNKTIEELRSNKTLKYRYLQVDS